MALAVEAYTSLRFALKRFGLSTMQQRSAQRQSWRLTTPPRTSGALLRDARGLSDLLHEWSREPRYRDAKGNPRRLPLLGPGPTFASLAQKFLPNMPLQEVIDMAVATAEVALRPGDKIALLGDALVNVAKNNSHLLAHAVRQMDQIFETSLHNARLTPNQQDTARMHRLVTGVIPKRAYVPFMREFRPQFAELLGRVDGSIKKRTPKTARALKSATAVSVAVYVSQEDDLERAGIDPVILVRRKKRRKRVFR